MNIPLTIVTAADASHYQPLVNLLWTISRYEPAARVIAWDLGLTASQSGLLNNIPPFYLKNWQMRQFDFSQYPDYFRLGDGNSGRMGFRPVTISAAAREFGGIVIWLDAGCQLRGKIGQWIAQIKAHGVYCAATSGTIAATLHPSARPLLHVTRDLLTLSIHDAGVAGFDTSNPKAAALIAQWKEIALNQNCTAPAGSNRHNHRQDAVFAVLLNQHGLAIAGPPPVGILTRRDNLSLSETKFRCRA